MSRQIRLMPVGGRPVPGVNPEIRPRALSLGYLPETVEKCRRGNQERRSEFWPDFWFDTDYAGCYHILSLCGGGSHPEKRISMDRTKWLTIEELAEYLKMGRTKLYRMAQEGDIPASKVGNQWRFDREEIDQWMKSQRPAAV